MCQSFTAEDERLLDLGGRRGSIAPRGLVDRPGFGLRGTRPKRNDCGVASATGALNGRDDASAEIEIRH